MQETNKTNSRREAAYIIARWILTKDFPSTLLPKGIDRAFVQDLVYTTIRRIRPLRKVLGVLVPKWPKGELEALLYVGAAQILYMPKVPDFAAVNETVEAARMCPQQSIAKVVNGTLRNLLRRREELEQMIANSSVEERESYPSELYRRWVNRFGEEKASQLALWHNVPAETFLARKDGSFVVLERGVKVEDVEGFSEGEFIVQDPATAMAISLINPQPGDLIFDACAAPGGKTIQLAWKGAKVVACEVNPKRRRRLEENLKRMKMTDVRVIARDEELADKTFTKVLVDAPCSNTGVLRRRPDARWNWNLEKLHSLTRLQAEILDWSSKRVALGGILVYSTCSNECEENEKQIEAFLQRHPEFELLEAQESIPVDTGYDGAFAASLIKKI